MNGPTPEKVMQIITGGWATSILGAACQHGIFTALEGNPGDTETVAKKTGISTRGAQALLDGLTGLGFLTLSEGRYQNSPDASAFLVKGKPSYLGGMAEVFLQDFATWQNLPEAAKTGLPSARNTVEVADNPFWHVLVPAIAALSFPVAQMAAERLGIANAGAVSWLDVGGGSGVWSAVWLGVNKEATGNQLDWPNVNKIARGFVSTFGVADRFQTIDGDFHTTDFGTEKYNYAIYAHIAHQESPAGNIANFRKFRRALKPGGTLVVNDFVLNDDRTGHPFALLFASQMLVVTKDGFTYRQSDYRNWLTEAGFQSVDIVPTSTPATVVFAS
ncbi:MAG TPA: methyltransferase dimerization domain-containing protein [Candidatus Saccharimonadales bacterium]|jgi:ubiquinone/menaquinone biosynthesis C-methylase UbiE|nr:methyltransferase dimerization domain-containing protein [Candidatus Saccharimonadales bacterium]